MSEMTQSFYLTCYPIQTLVFPSLQAPSLWQATSTSCFSLARIFIQIHFCFTLTYFENSESWNHLPTFFKMILASSFKCQVSVICQKTKAAEAMLFEMESALNQELFISAIPSASKFSTYSWYYWLWDSSVHWSGILLYTSQSSCLDPWMNSKCLSSYFPKPYL